MRYKHITNTPFARHRIFYPYCVWDEAFTNEELTDIENYCETFNKEPAKIYNAEESLDVIRKSKISWFDRRNHSSLNTLFNRLNSITEKVNDDYYNFDLNGYSSVQYTSYNAEENGEYGYHIDIHTGPNMEDAHMMYGDTRKLSMSLILSDPQSYEGGKFTFKLSEDEFEVEQKRGRIIFFPSFFLHKVHPVTKGIRKSIVAWVEGPKFR